MLVKVCQYISIALCVVILCACGYLAMHLQPQHPIPYGGKSFHQFAQNYFAAYDAYRIADFEKKVKGDDVDWTGVVVRVDHSGKSFVLAPFNDPHSTNGTRCTAFVVLDKEYVPETFRPGFTYARIKGKVHSVSVLGVIVEGTVAAEIY